MKLQWKTYGAWIKKHIKELVFIMLLGMVLVVGLEATHSVKRNTTKNKQQPEKKQLVRVSALPKVTVTPQPTVTPEETRYSYLQGPKSWKEGRTWSGEWGEWLVDGGSFGGFGCGLCCLANVYCSESQYKASPVDVYKFAKKHTSYAGGGAIAWEYMQSVLEKTGFQPQLYQKPSAYRTFQKQVKEASSVIVLVSSYNATCYWENTPGHYVTISLYDARRDKVFLADSGDPDHNRKWISLKKIYKSLKTSSDYQYMTVQTYDAHADQWKHKKASGKWHMP